MSEGVDAAQTAQLASLTGLDPAEAEGYLHAANGDLALAASLFFDQSAEPGVAQATEEQEEEEEEEEEEQSEPQRHVNMTSDEQDIGQAAPHGGRTLDGTYVAPIAGSFPQPVASSRQPAQQRGGLRTLRDLQSAGRGHGLSEFDDNQDDNQDFFAGGEKSGLAIQNPNQPSSADQINNILRRARQNAPRPGGDDERPSSHFHGTGTTLGGDDTPSRTISDPSATIPAPPPRAHRELHLWRDGFSVESGPLFRYDDPANAPTLEMINTGHAPLHILNVEHGQEVDVKVYPHKDEDYKMKYIPFSGAGVRLGSPTPGATSVAPIADTMTSTASASSARPAIETDPSAPTVMLQIRLGDGTRLQSRFNTTHTVGDVYQFVARASSASQEREFALMTTFPSNELTDKTQALGDLAEFKRGGVVVQKWK